MLHDFEIEMWRWPFFLAKKMFFNCDMVFSSIQSCGWLKIRFNG